MSTDTLPQIPEVLLRQKEEARAARAERQRREVEEMARAEETNRKLLALALEKHLGPEVAVLLLWPESFNGRTEEVSLELHLKGHAPVLCRFGRQTQGANGQVAYRWLPAEYEKCQGTPLLWEVELPGHSYNHRVATLGEALVLAEEGRSDDPDDQIPF